MQVAARSVVAVLEVGKEDPDGFYEDSERTVAVARDVGCAGMAR